MEKTVECSGLVLFPWEHMRENGRLTHALVSVPDSLLVTRAEHMSNSRMGQFLHLLPYLVVYVVDRCVHVAHTKHTHGFLSTICLKYRQLHISNMVKGLMEFWFMFFTVGRSFTLCAPGFRQLQIKVRTTGTALHDLLLLKQQRILSFALPVAMETTHLVWLKSCRLDGQGMTLLLELTDGLADWGFNILDKGHLSVPVVTPSFGNAFQTFLDTRMKLMNGGKTITDVLLVLLNYFCNKIVLMVFVID